MTDLEVLKQVCDTLDNLEIPTKYTEKLAVPILASSNLLKALYQAVLDAANKKKEEEAAIEESKEESEEN